MRSSIKLFNIFIQIKTSIRLGIYMGHCVSIQLWYAVSVYCHTILFYKTDIEYFKKLYKIAGVEVLKTDTD